MRMTTLGCDWCKGVARPAVASPRLVVGREPAKHDPTVDLCHAHLKSLLVAFKPRTPRKNGVLKAHPKLTLRRAARSVEDKRAQDRDRKRRMRGAASPASQERSAIRGEAYWGPKLAAALAGIPNSGTRVAAAELRQKLGLTSSNFGDLMRRLVGQGLVKTHGGASRWRTYERV